MNSDNPFCVFIQADLQKPKAIWVKKSSVNSHAWLVETRQPSLCRCVIAGKMDMVRTWRACSCGRETIGILSSVPPSPSRDNCRVCQAIAHCKYLKNGTIDANKSMIIGGEPLMKNYLEELKDFPKCCSRPTEWQKHCRICSSALTDLSHPMVYTVWGYKSPEPWKSLTINAYDMRSNTGIADWDDQNWRNEAFVRSASSEEKTIHWFWKRKRFRLKNLDTGLIYQVTLQ